MMKALDIRLARSRDRFLTMTVMLSAVYWRFISFHTIGLSYSLINESRSV